MSQTWKIYGLNKTIFVIYWVIERIRYNISETNNHHTIEALAFVEAHKISSNAHSDDKIYIIVTIFSPKFQLQNPYFQILPLVDRSDQILYRLVRQNILVTHLVHFWNITPGFQGVYRLNVTKNVVNPENILFVNLLKTKVYRHALLINPISASWLHAVTLVYYKLLWIIRLSMESSLSGILQLTRKPIQAFIKSITWRSTRSLKWDLVYKRLWFVVIHEIP